MLLSGIVRGALAGAAGVTALNAATYGDMAYRGRSASSTPQELVETLADKADVSIPGRGQERVNRLEGLGPLSGIATGVSVGAVSGWLRDHGLRLPAPLAVVLIGAGAMALADGPTAGLGLSDPRKWTTTDWLSDVLPHLAYGTATYAVLAATEKAAA